MRRRSVLGLCVVAMAVAGWPVVVGQVVAGQVAQPGQAGPAGPDGARGPATTRQATPESLRTILRLGAEVPASAALNKGATYNSLEGQASRVTTTFEDAGVTTVAVSERQSGALRARLSESGGGARAELEVTRAADGMPRLAYTAPGRVRVEATTRPELEPSLDWAARQAYVFAHDDVAEGAAGLRATRWQRNLIRRAGARPLDLEARIQEVRTEWPDGLVATARRPASRAEARGRGGAVITFTSVLEKDGVTLGWVRWHEAIRVLAWEFTDGRSGYLSPARLGEAGGWPFTPDMAWANVQAYAFYELPRRQVPPGLAAAAAPGFVQRIVEAVMPTLHAQDGCTDLHWLDGTIFRRCCDAHDLCYNAFGCDRYTWFWPFGNRWQCQSCNVSAVFCFWTIGGDVGYPYI
ncbi:MAG: hypothetical protein AB7O67_18280 [Vicinamibacterales bacterium]